jgi:hypothetical protein
MPAVRLGIGKFSRIDAIAQGDFWLVRLGHAVTGKVNEINSPRPVGFRYDQVIANPSILNLNAVNNLSRQKGFSSLRSIDSSIGIGAHLSQRSLRAL